MAIVEVRIDDRLIHGQVSSLWVPHFDVERILVVDDQIAQDEDRKMALKFGCPPQCKASFFDAAKAAEKLSRHIDQGVNVMIICTGPIPLLEMAKQGYTVQSITVGNMSRHEGTSALAKTAYVFPQDIDAFSALVDRGVSISFQPTPSNRRENLITDIQRLHQGE